MKKIELKEGGVFGPIQRPLPSTSSQPNVSNDLRRLKEWPLRSINLLSPLPGFPQPRQQPMKQSTEETSNKPKGFEELIQELTREANELNKQKEPGPKSEEKKASAAPAIPVLEFGPDFFSHKKSDPFDSFAHSSNDSGFKIESREEKIVRVVEQVKKMALNGESITEPMVIELLQKKPEEKKPNNDSCGKRIYEEWSEMIHLSLPESLKFMEQHHTSHVLSKKMGVEQKLITIISTFLAQKCVTNQEPVSSKPFRLLVEGLIEGLFHAKWMFYIDIGTPGEPSSLKWAADWVAIHICNEVKTTVPYQATLYGFYTFI